MASAFTSAVGSIGASVIQIDVVLRHSKIDDMKTTGAVMGMHLGAILNTKYTSDKGGLSLPGADKMDEIFDEVLQLKRLFGDLLVKDAGVLTKIADAFEKTDKSAGNSGSGTGPKIGQVPRVIQDVVNNVLKAGQAGAAAGSGSGGGHGF